MQPSSENEARHDADEPRMDKVALPPAESDSEAIRPTGRSVVTYLIGLAIVALFAFIVWQKNTPARDNGQIDNSTTQGSQSDRRLSEQSLREPPAREENPPPPGGRDSGFPRRGSPVKVSPAERRASSVDEHLSMDVVVQLTPHGSAPANLQLDAEQRKRLLEPLTNAIPILEKAYLAQAELELTLGEEQIAWLSEHRAQSTANLDTTLKMLDQRANEQSQSNDSLPPFRADAGHHRPLDLDELLNAPTNLEQASQTLHLSPAQAKKFREMLTSLFKARELERDLNNALRKQLRPEQLQFIRQAISMEAQRRTIPLQLIIERLSPTDTAVP